MSIIVNGVAFEHPVMNSAGMAKSWRDMLDLLKSASSAVNVGTLTGQARDGNPEPRYYFDTDRRISINSMGLPDFGLSYYEEVPDWYLAALLDLQFGKPMIFSIAPLGEDFEATLRELLATAKRLGAVIIELNLGCPNVWSVDGVQKRIASFDIDGWMYQMNLLLDIWDGPVWLKFSPYSDPMQLVQTAAAVVHLDSATRSRLSVVTSNSFPNGKVLDREGNSVLSMPYGGVAGPAYKPIALGQVAQWASALEGSGVSVIGGGGISTGQDVADFLVVGASLVQVATNLYNRDTRIFEEIVSEWVALAS